MIRALTYASLNYHVKKVVGFKFGYQGLSKDNLSCINLDRKVVGSIQGEIDELQTKLNEVNQKIEEGKNKAANQGELAELFNSKFKGNLAGKGDIIVKAAQDNGIEPELLAAIMANETGWGTSKAVNSQNNPGGIMGNGGLRSYNSIEEGINAMAKLLKTGYIDKGLTTIPQIGAKYCPVGAANDPTGLNSNWVPGVTKVYNDFKNS